MVDNNRIEEDYLDARISETPDLWDRIEASLTDKNAKVVKIEDAKEKVAAKKKSRRWIPAACSAAAACLLLVVCVPMLTGKQDGVELAYEETAEAEAPEASQMVASTDETSAIDLERDTAEPPEKGIDGVLGFVSPGSLGSGLGYASDGSTIVTEQYEECISEISDRAEAMDGKFFLDYEVSHENDDGKKGQFQVLIPEENYEEYKEKMLESFGVDTEVILDKDSATTTLSDGVTYYVLYIVIDEAAITE